MRIGLFNRNKHDQGHFALWRRIDNDRRCTVLNSVGAAALATILISITICTAFRILHPGTDAVRLLAALTRTVIFVITVVFKRFKERNCIMVPVLPKLPITNFLLILNVVTLAGVCQIVGAL